MTTHTATPLHHYSTKAVLVAVLALAVAAIVGFGVAALTLDQTTTTTTITPSQSSGGAADYLDKLRERQNYLLRACATQQLPDC